MTKARKEAKKDQFKVINSNLQKNYQINKFIRDLFRNHNMKLKNFNLFKIQQVPLSEKFKRNRKKNQRKIILKIKFSLMNHQILTKKIREKCHSKVKILNQ